MKTNNSSIDIVDDLKNSDQYKVKSNNFSKLNKLLTLLIVTAFIEQILIYSLPIVFNNDITRIRTLIFSFFVILTWNSLRHNIYLDNSFNLTENINKQNNIDLAVIRYFTVSITVMNLLSTVYYSFAKILINLDEFKTNYSNITYSLIIYCIALLIHFVLYNFILLEIIRSITKIKKITESSVIVYKNLNIVTDVSTNNSVLSIKDSVDSVKLDEEVNK